MKTLDISQGSEALAQYAREQKEPAVVVDGERPLFVLLPVEGADMETVSVTLSPQFQALWQRSLEQCPPGQGVSADEVRRVFGLEGKTSRRAG